MLKTVSRPFRIPTNDPREVHWNKVAKLNRAQLVLVDNFDKLKDGEMFQGVADDRCQGCNRILEKGNRYHYCRSCLRKLAEDFAKSNFKGEDPTFYLDQFRRDKKIKPTSGGRRRGGLRRT